MSTQSITETQQERKSVEFVVADLLTQFQNALELEDKSAATIRAYTIGFTDFRDWFERTSGQELSPALITSLDVKAWRAYLGDDRRLSPATINNYLAGLRAFCAWAVQAGYTEHNPADSIKSIKTVEEAPKWLEKQEQFKLLRACEQEVQLGDIRAGGDMTAPGAIWPRRDRALISLLLNAGLRRAEAAALRLDDLTIRPRSGHVQVRRGKGRKARRVELNKDVRSALQSWLDVRPESKGQAVFISQKGGRLRARSIAGVVVKLAEKAGLEDVTPHTLRHTCAKNLVDAGVSLDRVANALGHASLDTTRRYTIPSTRDMQTEMERIAWTE